MAKGLLGGMTDYSHQTFDDILNDLESERKNLLAFIKEIEKNISASIEKRYWENNVPSAFTGIIQYSLKHYKTSQQELTVIINEIQDFVEEHHLKRLLSIAKTAQEINVNIGQIWHQQYDLKDYQNANFKTIEAIYGDTRDMAVNLLDLSNIAERLKDFVGKKKRSTVVENSASEDKVLPRVVILTAINEEYDAVREHLTQIEPVKRDGTIYEQGLFSYMGRNVANVVIRECGDRNINASQETERAISNFRPDCMFFVGIAGSVKPQDFSLGDVIFPTKICYYEGGKAEKDEFKFRPDCVQPEYTLEELAKHERRNSEWKKLILNKSEKTEKVKAGIGTISSGEKILEHIKSELGKEIKSGYNDTAVIEMEGFGFARAIIRQGSEKKIKYGVVRGISDLVELTDIEDETGNRRPDDAKRVACDTAAAFAYWLIYKQYEDESRSKVTEAKHAVKEKSRLEELEKKKTRLLVKPQLVMNGGETEPIQKVDTDDYVIAELEKVYLLMLIDQFKSGVWGASIESTLDLYGNQNDLGSISVSVSCALAITSITGERTIDEIARVRKYLLSRRSHQGAFGMKRFMGSAMYPDEIILENPRHTASAISFFIQYDSCYHECVQHAVQFLLDINNRTPSLLWVDHGEALNDRVDPLTVASIVKSLNIVYTCLRANSGRQVFRAEIPDIEDAIRIGISHLFESKFRTPDGMWTYRYSNERERQRVLENTYRYTAGVLSSIIPTCLRLGQYVDETRGMVEHLLDVSSRYGGGLPTSLVSNTPNLGATVNLVNSVIMLDSTQDASKLIGDVMTLLFQKSIVEEAMAPGWSAALRLASNIDTWKNHFTEKASKLRKMAHDLRSGDPDTVTLPTQLIAHEAYVRQILHRVHSQPT